MDYKWLICFYWLFELKPIVCDHYLFSVLWCRSMHLMQLDSVTKKKYLVTCLFLWLCIVTWSVLKYTFITKGAMKLVVGYHRKRFCFPEWTVSQHIYTTLHWTSGNSLYVNPLPMVIWVVYCCGFFSVLVTKYIFWIFHFSIVLNLLILVLNFPSSLPNCHCHSFTLGLVLTRWRQDPSLRSTAGKLLTLPQTLSHTDSRLLFLHARY